jgi:aryl-alcohol dehydrogenase-like predicted oxidoreductase
MQDLVLEHTDLRISRLAFGTASLHHLYQDKKRQRVLETALSCGITHFDTSPYYGFGLAERDLGRLMRGRRNSITIATKVGLYPRGGAAGGATAVWARKVAGKIFSRLSFPRVDWALSSARNSLDESLRRLATGHVDLLLLHEPDAELLESDEFLRWLEGEREQGRIRYWGLAGVVGRLRNWVSRGDGLATVLQAADSIGEREADKLAILGRFPQITYGYLSSSPPGMEPTVVMQQAFGRNRAGSVIFSSRRPEHITSMARLLV